MIYWQAGLAVLLSAMVLKAYGLRSIISLVVIRDVLVFGVPSLVILTHYADELEWHPLIQKVLDSNFQQVTNYSLQAFIFLLLSALLLRRAITRINYYPDMPMVDRRSRRAFFWFSIVILAGIIANLINFGPPKQILYLIDMDAARSGRAEIGAAVRANPFLGYLRRLIIEPLALFLTYKLAVTMPILGWPKKILSMILIMGAFIIVTWEGQKSLILLFVIFYVFAATSDWRRMVGATVILGVPALFLLARIMVIHYTGSDTGQDISLFGSQSEFTIRLIGSAFGVYFYDLYSLNFLGGDIIIESIPASGMLWALSEHDAPVAASRQMMELIHPGSDTGNLFNTYYFGQAQSVFGPLGGLYSSAITVFIIYIIHVLSGFCSRASKAYGLRFLVPYCALFVIQLTGDLSSFLFGKIIFKLLFSLLVISAFWKLISATTDIRRKTLLEVQ